MFNSYGQPVGAQITNYLLEKVRWALICTRGSRFALLIAPVNKESSRRAAQGRKKFPHLLSVHERSHAGAEGYVCGESCIRGKLLTMFIGSFAEAFGLQGPEAYAYTSKSNTLSVSSIDDVKDFAETIVSIKLVISRPRADMTRSACSKR
jgi:hypothetical protein